jgi:hypothetical protein
LFGERSVAEEIHFKFPNYFFPTMILCEKGRNRMERDIFPHGHILMIMGISSGKCCKNGKRKEKLTRRLLVRLNAGRLLILPIVGSISSAEEEEEEMLAISI